MARYTIVGPYPAAYATSQKEAEEKRAWTERYVRRTSPMAVVTIEKGA